ncbi:MAG: hypothetical protein OXD01_11155 [Gammaproteobacteria bacterium]|nr:hypothetical protein [Gammaproteobacteria bacterium]
MALLPMLGYPDFGHKGDGDLRGCLAANLEADLRMQLINLCAVQSQFG